MSTDFENIIRKMMTPSPNERPDVETLLRWPQIKTELENRRKLAPLKYMVNKTYFLLLMCECLQFLHKFTDDMFPQDEKFYLAKYLPIKEFNFSTFWTYYYFVCYDITQNSSKSPT